MSRAATYTRVSTEEQAIEGFSLDVQLDRVKKYVEAQGWHAVSHYCDDGHSGRNTRRPAYQRMMAEKESWDVMVVLKMDRIHRNSPNFMEMMDRLADWGKEFASVQEHLDTGSAMGRFVMDIIQRIAQLESEQIGERTDMGMREKAQSHKAWQARPMYGYKVVDGCLKIVHSEARWVRYMFAQASEGYTPYRIAKFLNQRGVTTRKGNIWRYQAVRNILKNPAYRGTMNWGGIIQHENHPAILVD